MAIKIKGVGSSDVGRVRKSNQDSGYTGQNLFMVADGMGGHAGGDIASALVTQRMAQLDAHYLDTASASKQVLTTMWQANAVLGETVQNHPELAGMGTTVSAILFVGSKAVIAHIGDSRVYLARGGGVRQITKDHTFVQRLVDTGRITPEEALVHPRRSVLMRVIGDIEQFPEIDTQVIDTKPGDRWLICSDGLSGVVPEQIMNRILVSETSPEETCELLVSEALEFGAPDNVTVAVVDIAKAADTAPIELNPIPTFLGSAQNEVVISSSKGKNILRLFNPLLLTEFFGRTEETSSVELESEELLEEILAQTRTKIRKHRVRGFILVVLLIALGIGGVFAGYLYTQTRFYVGESNGRVAIYQGIHESLGGFGFSHLYQQTNLDVLDLPNFQQDLVKQTIVANDLADAERIIADLNEAVESGD